MISFNIFYHMSLAAFLSHLFFGLGLVIISIGITRIMLQRIRIMDIPNTRSSHDRPVPKSGGLAIVATFLVGIMAIYLLGDNTPITQWYFIGFIMSALTIATVSLYDDMKYRTFKVKLGSQVIAAAVVLAFGIIIDEIALPWIGPIQLGLWAYPISFLWIVGLTNAFNFMDGLDGLAAGTAVLVSAFFGIITLSQGSTFVYISCYTLLAGSLGFLLYNFPPARIFMGDVGSSFIGFVFATISIIAGRYDHSHTSFLVMPLLLFHFIFDTSFTYVRRLLRKEHVTYAHRTHLYQLFNQLGYSHLTVSLTHGAICILQGLGAMYMVNIPGAKRVFVFLPFLILEIIYAWVVISNAKKNGILK